MTNQRVRTFAGFSLIELFVVLFIMVLLTVMVVPAFSKLVKTSRVQQASKQILTMLWQARSEAQHYRGPVVVFFGDDPALLPVQPIAGVMPPKGTMEMWTCQRGRNANDDMYISEAPPYWVENPAQQCPGWYPHRVKLNNLTPISGSLPADIRILCGDLLTGNYGWIPPGSFDHEFRCTGYRQDSIGELRRHQVGYGMDGSLSYQSYGTILVYEETSGDYQLIVVAIPGWSSRPQLIPDRIKTIMNVPLKNQMDLPRMLKTIKPDS